MPDPAIPPQEVVTPPTPKPARRSPLRAILLVVLGLLVLLLVGIQLIPVNRANAAVTTPIKWDSPQTEALARRACMDCHSNETTWPVYSYVAPVSWLVYYDVVRGRSQLNFSTINAAASRGIPQGNPFSQPSNDLAYTLGQALAGGARGEQRPEGANRPPNGQFPNRGNGQPQATPGQFPTRTPGQGQTGQGQPGQGGFQRGFSIVNRIDEVFQNNSMPPANYTLLHPSANLSQAERDQLLKGLQATFAPSTTSTSP